MLNQSLFVAIEHNDIAEVQTMLSAGVDPNITDADGFIPLMYAAQKGNIAMMTILLDAGANVFAKDNGGKLLEFAIDSNSADVITILFDKGVTFSREEIGQALVLTAHVVDNPHDCLAMVKILLENGADVNAHNNQGTTALTYAAVKGKAEVVEALLIAGANPNARDNDTETVLMWAAAVGHTSIIQRLLQAGAEVNSQTDNGGTALRWAVKYGHLKTVRALLVAGADANAPNVIGAAIFGHHYQILEMLIKYGVDFNQKIIEGIDSYKALAYAKKLGNRDMMLLLKQAGATE